MEHNFKATRLKQSRVTATMELISSKGEKRVRQQRGVSKLKPNGLDSRGLTVFDLPNDIKNTAVLIDEDQADGDKVWIYLPALKKNRRLPGSGKTENFVGSDFTYGDIIVPKVAEYKHTLSGQEPCPDDSKIKCYVVDSVPASSDILETRGVSAKRQWVRADNYMVVRYETKDRAGRPWKSFLGKNPKLVDPKEGKYLLFDVEITDIQSKHRTRLILNKVDVVSPVSDDLLTTMQLERGLPQ